jgi:hypothetical protein
VTAIYLRFHAWRAFRLRPDEPELFHFVVSLGFVSLFICRTCLIDARRKLRSAIEEAVSKDAAMRGHGWRTDTSRFDPNDLEGR